MAQVALDDGDIHTVDAPSEEIEVRDGPGPGLDPTTLNVVDGADIGVSATVSRQSIGLFENSILQMSGGAMQGDLVITDNAVATLDLGAIGGDVLAQGSGRFEMNGGNADDMVFEGSSRLEMNGGEVADDVTVRGSATARFAGGIVHDELFVEGDAQVEVISGDFGDEVFVIDSATANFSGGTIADDLNPGGNSVVLIDFVTLEDSVDAAGTSMTTIHGGFFEGSVAAVDSAKVNILGGDFPNVFSGGEEILAAGPGAMVVITGGTFGTAGESDDGRIAASQGGMVSFSDAVIVGHANGDASPALFSALLNGVVHLSNAQFGDLALEAGNSGILNVGDIVADRMTVTTLAGGEVNINGGQADSLEVFAELGSFVNLRGGDFGEIDVTLQTDSVLTIFGHSFTFLGTSVDLLTDPDAYIEETGELRTIGGDLAGILADGTPFAMTYSRQFNPAPGARVFLVQIPEPGTELLALVALAGLAIPYRGAACHFGPVPRRIRFTSQWL